MNERPFQKAGLPTYDSFCTFMSLYCYCPLERASGGFEDTGARRPAIPLFTAQGWPKQLPREERVWDTAADGSWLQRGSTFNPVGNTVRPGTGM